MSGRVPLFSANPNGESFYAHIRVPLSRQRGSGSPTGGAREA